MSDVKRYWVPNGTLDDQSGWHQDDNEVVLASEHDRELSALRDDLVYMTTDRNDFRKRLTAAEQRNAELKAEVEVQRESKEQWEKVAADWVLKSQTFSNLMQEFCDRVDRGEVRSKSTYAKFKAALKPTESGASDAQ